MLYFLIKEYALMVGIFKMHLAQTLTETKSSWLSLSDFVRPMAWEVAGETFANAQPFDHIVIDDFFHNDIADKLSQEFPAFDAPCWNSYSNAIEEKKTCNHYDRFPETTYQAIDVLNGPEFVRILSDLTGFDTLRPDYGLNGGGWHIHSAGGKLNTHLDYSIHPKIKMERRLNIIIHLSKDWNADWGGGLGLWSHDAEKFAPKDLIKTVPVKFNRAVLFDTTQNSWHGLPDPIRCPEGVYRKTLALYYLTPPREGVSDRGKALFAPHDNQKGDPEVMELIKKRASVGTAADVYRK